jgi:hypothetical protein
MPFTQHARNKTGRRQIIAVAAAPLNGSYPQFAVGFIGTIFPSSTFNSSANHRGTDDLHELRPAAKSVRLVLR